MTPEPDSLFDFAERKNSKSLPANLDRTKNLNSKVLQTITKEVLQESHLKQVKINQTKTNFDRWYDLYIGLLLLVTVAWLF